MRFLCAITVIMLLSACGFEPVHGRNTAQNHGSQLILNQVAVEVPTPGRIGQLFRIALQDALHPGNKYPQARYRLTSSIEEIKQPIIIELDARITRYNLVLKANYELTDMQEGESVVKSQSQRISSYNVSDSDFATYVADRDARERGVQALAQAITQELVASLEVAP